MQTSDINTDDDPELAAEISAIEALQDRVTDRYTRNRLADFTHGFAEGLHAALMTLDTYQQAGRVPTAQLREDLRATRDLCRAQAAQYAQPHPTTTTPSTPSPEQES